MQCSAVTRLREPLGVETASESFQSSALCYLPLSKDSGQVPEIWLMCTYSRGSPQDHEKHVVSTLSIAFLSRLRQLSFFEGHGIWG